MNFNPEGGIAGGGFHCMLRKLMQEGSTTTTHAQS